MPAPAKPCEGRFREDLQETLTQNRDRAQWANHRCEACGLEVGAVINKGVWIPEQHWPSVKYPVRTPAEKKKSVPTTLSHFDVVEHIAETVS